MRSLNNNKSEMNLMRYFNQIDVQSFRKSLILENFSINKRSYQTFDVFLSYSSKDKDILPSAINFLSQYHVNVYIDIADEALPEKPSPETGKMLKNRICEARKFIVLISENSKDSKWIPWELGIADEKKKINNIALLPTTQDGLLKSWPEQEYLGLYERIVYGNLKGYTSPVWMVYDHHTNTATELGLWLK